MFVEAEHITLQCRRCKKTLSAIKACKANGDCVYLDPNTDYLSRIAYCERCDLLFVKEEGKDVQS